MIEKIIMPDSVDEVEYAAFRNLTYLKTVEFPNTLEVISSEAFSNCTSL